MNSHSAVIDMAHFLRSVLLNYGAELGPEILIFWISLGVKIDRLLKWCSLSELYDSLCMGFIWEENKQSRGGNEPIQVSCLLEEEEVLISLL